jgi:hypothetical protein
MAKIPKVGVVVLSYNGKKDTLQTLESLLDSNIQGFGLEIVVVDNGSKDGSAEAIEDKGIPNVKVIRNAKNLGFAGGNNIGIRYCLKKGLDYIALINNDTIVDKNLIRNILREHESNEKYGAISPKIYFAKGFEFHKRYKDNQLGRVVWYAGGDIDWNNVYGSNHGVDEVDKGQFDKTEETPFFTGCFVMFKSHALKETGLFDERYFAYLEDADLSQRMEKMRWKIIYSPKGHLWHKVAGSSGIGSELNDYYITRNRMLFGMTYAPFRSKLALIRESLRLLFSGRSWQRVGIRDYYLGRFGKGSWHD